jgi:hypothetical protein
MPAEVGAESGRRAVSVLVRIRYPRERPMQGKRRLRMILDKRKRGVEIVMSVAT